MYNKNMFINESHENYDFSFCTRIKKLITLKYGVTCDLIFLAFRMK